MVAIASIYATPTFKIGDIEVELPSALQFSQSYEPVGGWTDLRLASGDLLRQTYWRRVKTTLSGEGMLPVGISGLDVSAPLVVSCAAPMTYNVPASTPVVPIPKARRTDAAHLPSAKVWWGGVQVPAVCTIADIGDPKFDQATVSADTAIMPDLSKASSATVQIFPEFSAYVTFSESFVRETSRFRWEITALEV